jgi:predicted kinase
MDGPGLIVLAGKPGTGKTTLARGLASTLHAVYLRVDAIETAKIQSGLAEPPVGVIGPKASHRPASGSRQPISTNLGASRSS